MKIIEEKLFKIENVCRCGSTLVIEDNDVEFGDF